MRVFAGVETLEVHAKDANRTLTEENLDDDDDYTLQDSEGAVD